MSHPTQPRDDGLVSVRPLLDRAPRFADLIEGEADGAAFAPLRRSELIGRPLGSPNFVAEIEKRLKRRLAPGKRGRKPQQEGGSAEANKVKTVILRNSARHRNSVTVILILAVAAVRSPGIDPLLPSKIGPMNGR